jgi:hypothetical protein
MLFECVGRPCVVRKHTGAGCRGRRARSLTHVRGLRLSSPLCENGNTVLLSVAILDYRRVAFPLGGVSEVRIRVPASFSQCAKRLGFERSAGGLWTTPGREDESRENTWQKREVRGKWDAWRLLLHHAPGQFSHSNVRGASR